MGLGLDGYPRERKPVELVLAPAATGRPGDASVLAEDAQSLFLALACRIADRRRALRCRDRSRVCLPLVLGRLLCGPGRPRAAVGLADHAGPARRHSADFLLARAQALHHATCR